MKILVESEAAWNFLLGLTADSRVRIEVVPTAVICWASFKM